jgi:hypothetical protein
MGHKIKDERNKIIHLFYQLRLSIQNLDVITKIFALSRRNC